MYFRFFMPSNILPLRLLRSGLPTLLQVISILILADAWSILAILEKLYVKGPVFYVLLELLVMNLGIRLKKLSKLNQSKP